MKRTLFYILILCMGVKLHAQNILLSSDECYEVYKSYLSDTRIKHSIILIDEGKTGNQVTYRLFGSRNIYEIFYRTPYKCIVDTLNSNILYLYNNTQKSQDSTQLQHIYNISKNLIGNHLFDSTFDYPLKEYKVKQDSIIEKTKASPYLFYEDRDVSFKKDILRYYPYWNRRMLQMQNPSMNIIQIESLLLAYSDYRQFYLRRERLIKCEYEIINKGIKITFSTHNSPREIFQNPPHGCFQDFNVLILVHLKGFLSRAEQIWMRKLVNKVKDITNIEIIVNWDSNQIIEVIDRNLNFKDLINPKEAVPMIEYYIEDGVIIEKRRIEKT